MSDEVNVVVGDEGVTLTLSGVAARDRCATMSADSRTTASAA